MGASQGVLIKGGEALEKVGREGPPLAHSLTGLAG